MRPRHPSRIDVDTAAIRRNAQALIEEMAPARVVCVVKSNAYGHGYHTIVPAAASAGIRDFAVFSAHEADHVLSYAPEGTRIMIMGHQKPEDLPWIARNNIEVWANDPEDVQDLVARPPENGKGVGVHVEVETGMHRTGLSPAQAIEAAQRLVDEDSTRLAGLCTHLAGAEDPINDDRIASQIAIFEEVRTKLEEVGVRPRCHVASSSAALRWPERRYDAVRCGIASYGLWPTPTVRELAVRSGTKVKLEPALSWHSWVMACKDVPAGSCVGYGESFCTAEDARIGIIPVGYGDGFTRQLSMKGHVLVRGRRCPIVGQVNMNMVMVLLEDPAVRPGDSVVLIGRQADERIGVHSFSEWNEIVDYEFMARLGWEVPRICVDLDPTHGPDC